MSLVSITSFIYPYHYNVIRDNSNSTTLDNAADRIAVVFSIPKTGNVTAVGWTTTTVTSSQSIDTRIETIDAATGHPSGTLYHANATVAQATLASTTYYEPTFASAAPVTAENMVAVVLQYTSTAGTISFRTINQLFNSLMFPYGDCNLTGSYGKDTSKTLSIVLKYDDGLYYEVGVPLPISNTNISVSYNVDTVTFDEYGIKFSVPVPCRVSGVWLGGSNVSAGGTADVVLYGSDGSTTLESISLDGDIQAGSSTAGYMYMKFATPQTLTKDTYYRLTLKPTNATNSTLMEFTYASSAILDAISGGSNVHETKRLNTGAWTDTTNIRPWMGVIIDQLDNGVGGGGGMIVNPGMDGGMRG